MKKLILIQKNKFTINKRQDNGKSIIVIDENRAMFVRRAYELYSHGNISYKELARKLSLEGFTTKKGQRVTQRSIEVMLQNPFYIGKFVWNGEIYEGKHTPIISQDLYYKVSDLFDNPKRQRNRINNFSYSGMFQCECGHYLSVEKQYGQHKSGEYLYLRCKHKELHKSGKGYYISTKEVDKAINDLLSSIRIKDEYITPLKQGLIEMHKTRTNDNQLRIEQINNEIKETQNLLDTLLEKPSVGASLLGALGTSMSTIGNAYAQYNQDKYFSTQNKNIVSSTGK